MLNVNFHNILADITFPIELNIVGLKLMVKICWAVLA